MEELKIGDLVSWVSSSKGTKSAKHGIIIDIAEGGQSITVPERYSNVPKKNIKFNRLISTYKKALVEVEKDSQVYLYCPNYSFLTRF